MNVCVRACMCVCVCVCVTDHMEIFNLTHSKKKKVVFTFFACVSVLVSQHSQHSVFQSESKHVGMRAYANFII